MKVPDTVVALGRAVEIDADTWIWTWNKRDNWIVCANVMGNALFCFKLKSSSKQSPIYRSEKTMNDALRLYRRFNHHGYRDFFGVKTIEPKKRVGRAIHIVYESDKFGPKEQYIHHFSKYPYIWTDNPAKPKVLALTGGAIKITTRGIEG